MKAAATRVRTALAPRRVAAEMEALCAAVTAMGAQMTAGVHYAMDRTLGKMHGLAVKVRVDVGDSASMLSVLDMVVVVW